MAKRVSPCKIRIHNQYTLEKAEEALGVSEQTVHLWRQAGWPALGSQKWHLFLGLALKDFMKQRSNKPGRSLAAGEFFACSATCQGGSVPVRGQLRRPHGVASCASWQKPTAKPGNDCLATDAQNWPTPKSLTGGANSQRETRWADCPDLQETALKRPMPAARKHRGENGPKLLTNVTGRLHMDQLPNEVAHGFHSPGPSDAAVWAEVIAISPHLVLATSLGDCFEQARNMAATMEEAQQAQAEPTLRRMAYGLADRARALRLLGNGVHPLAAAYAWRTLSHAHGLGSVDMGATDDRAGSGDAGRPVQRGAVG